MAPLFLEEFVSKKVEVPLGVVFTTRPYVWEIRETWDPAPFREETGRRLRKAFFVDEERPFPERPQSATGKLRLTPEQQLVFRRVSQLNREATYLDGWEVREEFLSLKNEPEFLAFLGKVGRFSGYVRDHGCWEFQDFQGWQQIFRAFLKYSPPMWNGYLTQLESAAPGFNVRPMELTISESIKARLHLRFSWQRRSAVIWVLEAVTAILATIYIDHLRGLKFRFCARQDCRRPFEITSKHKRKYCQQYCAHLESLRRMRKRQRRR